MELKLQYCKLKTYFITKCCKRPGIIGATYILKFLFTTVKSLFRNRLKSLIDENNKLKYEIENLQRAAKLFSEEVQNELRNDSMLVFDWLSASTIGYRRDWFEIITSEKTTTIDALKEGINKQKSEHQRQKSKLKRERVNI